MREENLRNSRRSSVVSFQLRQLTAEHAEIAEEKTDEGFLGDLCVLGGEMRLMVES
jgi:hypothetical protein